mmetsp:Transcript_20661/g.48229  ORF Transcript_20661/g.48229 Transcript_20661/m.48229 type:complete len:247 (-) Transcript_20661:22-762(-)
MAKEPKGHRVQLVVTPLNVLQAPLSWILPGAYHTSIVIDGKEIWFNATGISKSPPGASHVKLGRRPQVIDMGTSDISGDRVFSELSRHFGFGSYDLIRKNCNDFSACALEFLGCGPFPPHFQNMEKFAKAGLIDLATFGGYERNPEANDFDRQRVIDNLLLLRCLDPGEYGPVPRDQTPSPAVDAEQYRVPGAQSFLRRATPVVGSYSAQHSAHRETRLSSAHSRPEIRPPRRASSIDRHRRCCCF